MIKKIKILLLKIWIRRPATKLDVVNARYELKQFIDIVKEIEEMRRSNITNIVFRLNELEKNNGKKKKKSNEKDDRSIYA
jgi:hypothetical protein